MVSLAKKNIKTISIKDANYPNLLREIYDPPSLLYFCGKLDSLEKICLAVVGSRKYSPYGKQVIDYIIPLLAKRVTIISGLARGIDSLTQAKTVAEGGITIGVLGSGIDEESIYPKENLGLAKRIIEAGGAIISEFPPGSPPQKQNFPKRNRIISGLAHGTLIIEAGLKSGSLITARCALEQGREVMAVPGNICSPTSIGTNNLIKLGARAIGSQEDILEAVKEIKLDKT